MTMRALKHPRMANCVLAILIVVFVAFLWSYVVPCNVLTVESTEERVLVVGDGEITVDVPMKYTQLTTMRLGLPIRAPLLAVGDPVAPQIAEALMSDAQGMNLRDQAYLVSQFVSDNIEYRPDAFEHWKLPWETVRDGYGDCEDMALLAQAIMNSMGLDSVLVVSLGHAMVAVNTGDHWGAGEYHHNKYYKFMEATRPSTPGSVDSGPCLLLDSGYNIWCVLAMTFYAILIVALISVSLTGNGRGRTGR